jgi:preprotein translocase SecE subunit
MAVADKAVMEKATGNPQREFAQSCLIEAVYALFALGMIFSGIPVIWGEIFFGLNEFLSGALQLLVVLGAAVGFVYLGRELENRLGRLHGLRSGAFFCCVFALGIAWVGLWLGGALDNAEMGTFGAILTVAVMVGLGFGAIRVFLKPGFQDWIMRVEDQGWFHASSYKANQGIRVRRGSMLCLIVLGACGLITLITHGTLGSDRFVANNWIVDVPFTNSEIPLMFRIHYTVPVVLGLVMLWISWRVVNWPVFTDFLIATEAEMNKVSWSSRRRLWQDTVVVLVTVILLTTFLFLVDILWINVLSWVQVLKVDVRAEQLKQQEKTQW